jgi:hypothetical protein
MPNITLPQIQSSIGLNISAKFISEDLGIEPIERDKRAMFWEESQFDDIKAALCAHIERSRLVSAPPKKAAPEKKAVPAKKAAASSDLDDDDEL